MRDVNVFTLTGYVNRVTVIKGGYIISLTNRRDYKKDDEWIEKKNYLSFATFSNIEVNEGDVLTVSGEVETYKNKEGNTVMSLRADVIQNHGKPARAENKPEKKVASKPAKKPVSDEDDDELFG